MALNGWSTLPFTGSEVPLIAFAGAAAIAAGALLRRRWAVTTRVPLNRSFVRR